MFKKNILVLLVFVSISCLFSQQKDVIAIKCRKYFDGKNFSTEDNWIILIEGNKIKSIGKNLQPPENATIIDLSNSTLLPGFIDTHTHMYYHAGNYNDNLLKKSLQYRAIWSTIFAKKTLMQGFTSVRDLETEGAWYGDVALRDAINDGLVPGPRMQCATRALSITGGYSPYGYSPDVNILKGAQIADGIDGLRYAVREQFANGADLIKIYIDHRRRGTPSSDSLSAWPTFSLEEAKLIVHEANKVNAKVAAHAYNSESAQTAINAGVASIEHGLYLDDQTFKLMSEKNVYYVPTLGAYMDYLKDKNSSAEYIRLMKGTTEKHKETFQRALKSNVKIAFGSDCNSEGDATDEFVWMVNYGMSPLTALRSVTTVAAELMGWQDKVGSINEGKLADLVAVAGNPLKDISELKKVIFVMKDGKVYKN